MLGRLFLQILNMSFTASFVILAVIVARLLLKKAPRVISYALWAVVLFRLVCPFSFESAVSLLPVRANPIPPGIVYSQTPQINTGVNLIDHAVNASLPAARPAAGMNPMQGLVAIGAFLWLCGIASLAVYSLLSLFLLKRKLRGVVRGEGNVYLADGLASPFVMGLFRTKIYLPANLTEEEKRYIILHEQTHIKRLDHLVKIVSFAVLCLHWFNPLVWAAFFLCGKDMEMSCDEAVIKKLGADVKKDYSSSLLSLATGRRIVGGSPLAFGEGDTKSRIKNVLHYKKPAFWVIVVSIIAVAAVGIGLAANPKKPPSATNTIYTAHLTPAQKAEITMRYELADDSDIFETKFHLSENIKSYAYYVELYQRGRLVGRFVENYGNLNTKDGSIVTAFSMNRGADRRGENMRWMSSFADGGYASHPAIPFPDGFVPQGVAISTLTNEGDAEKMPKIVPEQPVMLANIGMHSAEQGVIESFDCTYLMENPEAIERYECIYLVQCVFSEQDETALAKTLASSRPTEGSAAKEEFFAATMTEHENGEDRATVEFTSMAAIHKLRSLLLVGALTDLASTNDVPNQQSYFHISLQGEKELLHYYIYTKDDQYYIEQPYNGIREIDVDTVEQIISLMTEESREEVAKTPADVQAFLNQISQSFQIKEGAARFVVPAQMPSGYDASQLSVRVSGSMPMGDDGSQMSLHAFEKEDEARDWKPGKEYIARMFDAEVPDDTEVYASFYLMEKNDGAEYYATVYKLFPLREDHFTPSVAIKADGAAQTVTFTDRFNDKLTLACTLPDGWSLKAPATAEAPSTGEVEIYAGGARVGGLSYERFKLYRDEAGNIPYLSVYSGIMLGSMASWDNEYTEMQKDETTCVATCKPWHNVSFPGVANASAPAIYSKGILAYHTGARKYVAIAADEDAATDAEWQAIAKSVKLSVPTSI